MNKKLIKFLQENINLPIKIAIDKSFCEADSWNMGTINRWYIGQCISYNDKIFKDKENCIDEIMCIRDCGYNEAMGILKKIPVNIVIWIEVST